MRYKLIKTALTVFIMLLCTVALISAKHYVKTIESFKSFYNHSRDSRPVPYNLSPSPVDNVMIPLCKKSLKKDKFQSSAFSAYRLFFMRIVCFLC